MNKTLQFIIDNWLIIGPVLYEIIARAWPTKINISLLDNIWIVLNKIIPNVRKADGKEIIPGAQTVLDLPNSNGSTKKSGLLKNLVKVAVNRFVLKCIAIFFISVPAFAQNNGTFKAIASYNTDSTTVRNYISLLQTSYGNVGGIYYNKQSSKWRAYQDSTWIDLIQSGGGGGGGTVTSVTGTADRITVTDPTTTPVVNIASTYAGQNTITNVGTLTAGATGVGFNLNFTNSTKTGLIPIVNGGTNLSTLGSALQVLRVNSGATALEYATPFSVSLGAATQIPFMNGAATNYSYASELTYVAGSKLTSAPLLDLGISSTAGVVREISAVGSSADIGLSINGKGNGDLSLSSGSTSTTKFTYGTNTHLLSAGQFTFGVEGSPIFTIKSRNVISASLKSADVFIKSGDSNGPSAVSSGKIVIKPGLSYASKPGNVIISGGINSTADDSGDVILASAQYTGDSATVSVKNTGEIEFRSHGEIAVRPNTLNTSTYFTLDDTRLNSNMISGTATLVGGTATVTFDYIAGDIVMLTVQTPGGTQGFLSIDNAGAGSFDIVSTSATETSTVGWFVITHF